MIFKGQTRFRRFVAWMAESILLLGAIFGGVVGFALLFGTGSNIVMSILGVVVLGEALVCFLGVALLARLASIDTVLRNEDR